MYVKPTKEKVFDETSSERSEFKGQIVDIFEDWLDDHDYMLNNPERKEAIENGEYDDSSEAAIIWGEDYDIIANTVEEVLDLAVSNKIDTKDIPLIMDSFKGLCADNKIDLSEKEAKNLMEKVNKTFKNWKII